MAEQVTRTIEIDLAPEEVWGMLVDDEERSAWFGGDTRLEPVPGGEGHFTDPDGTTRRAVVDDVEPGRRLSWTWWPEDGSDVASRVRIDLDPVPVGTRVVVIEAPVAPSVQASTARPARVPVVELEHRCLLRAAAVVA